MEQLVKLNVAIISPNGEAYSETFIKAQRTLLPHNVFYYWGGNMPTMIESNKLNFELSFLERKIRYILVKFGIEKLDKRERCLAKSLKQNKIDVVLAQYGPTGEQVCQVCEDCKIPLVVHFHGYDASVYEVLKSLKNYKRIFSKAQNIIAVSHLMKRKLIEIGCPKEKICYISYGPNDIFLDIKPKYNSFQFIAIGRFTDKKAHYYTILAFNEVLKEYPQARLVIYGTGELYNVCLNLIRYLDINDAVTLPGVCSPDEFKFELENSIAFIQHSIVAVNGDSEGTPLAVLEASASGLPVVSTKHAGIPDVILNDITGYLVDEHDVEGMANAMKKLLANKNLCFQLGQAGSKRIKEFFTMEKYIMNLSDLLISAVIKR